MRSDRELGVDSICCLLHNMVAGGSAWQWIHLLERHVQAGGTATILAPPGPLSARARSAGIDLVEVAWNELPRHLDRGPWPVVAAHDVAVVHWDHEVMHAFSPALAVCGRAALVLHQAPAALTRWFGEEILVSARGPLDEALAAANAVVLTRGEWHRRRFVDAFEIPARQLRILPASIPLPAVAVAAPREQPEEVLALMRLSPDKAPICQLAVELVRARLAMGAPCRLAIAGEGPWRPAAIALCEQRLQPGCWRLEDAPADPIARLAAADVVVAQGLTTLEATALGRRVVVARAVGQRAGGTVLTPERYDVAARDPFGQPAVSEDCALLWRGISALDRAQLDTLRQLVARNNSLETASKALGEALAATAPTLRGRLRARLRPRS